MPRIRPLIKKISYVLRYYKRPVFLNFLSIIVGALTGLIIVMFRILIEVSHNVFFDVLGGFLENYLGDYAIIFLPAIGGLIVGGIFSALKIKHDNIEVSGIIKSLQSRMGILSLSDIPIGLVGAAITMGSGGSAGREAPSAVVGAGVGCELARIVKIKGQDKILLIIAGLAAGISATFNAPLGGLMFGIELFFGELTVPQLIPITLACFTSTIVTYFLLGPEVTVRLPPVGLIQNPIEYLLFAILGLFSGILAGLWVRFFFIIKEYFEKIKVPEFIKPAIGGLLVGLIGLWRPEVLGMQYHSLQQVASSYIEIAAGIAFLIGLFKIIATSLTLGSGGAGGNLAPAIFIGGFIGASFALFLSQVFSFEISSIIPYILVGMASFLGSSIGIPLTAIVIVGEVTGEPAMVLPLMIGVATSSITAHFFMSPLGLYRVALMRDGVKIGWRIPELARVPVETAMKSAEEVITVSPNTTLTEVEKIFIKHGFRHYPVVENSNIVGVISIDDVEKVPIEKRATTKVCEVMDKNFVRVYPDENLWEALEKMLNNNKDFAIVVSRGNDDKFLGILAEEDIIRIYEILHIRF